jgi:3-oxoacyl-[acyl-carrier-protein] synthase-3
MYHSRIIGLGHFVPDLVVTNDELAKIIGVDADWIQTRTGIKERRFAQYGKDTNSSMAIQATIMALRNANVYKEAVELIIYSTQASDSFSPSSAYTFQYEFGFHNIPVLDIRGQCSGFIQALSIADQYIKAGMYKYVLVVSSELNSVYLDKSPKGVDTTPIFGDGAGAVLLEGVVNNLKLILSTHLHADGQYANSISISLPIKRVAGSNGWNYQLPTNDVINMYMDGRTVFRNACRYIPAVIYEALEANNISKEDVNFFLVHQANIRIIEAIMRLMKIQPSKMYNNIENYGNTVSASIPILLSEAWEKKIIKPGDLVCLSSFGSGFNWASALIRF